MSFIFFFINNNINLILTSAENSRDTYGTNQNIKHITIQIHSHGKTLNRVQLLVNSLELCFCRNNNNSVGITIKIWTITSSQIRAYWNTR